MAAYFWEHHCKKGKRVRYDGKPIDWSKHPAKDAPVDTEVFEWSSHVNKEEIQAYTASVSASVMFFVEALGVWARDMFLPALPVVGFGAKGKQEPKPKRG